MRKKEQHYLWLLVLMVFSSFLFGCSKSGDSAKSGMSVSNEKITSIADIFDNPPAGKKRL